MAEKNSLTRSKLRTPRAAALAGIAFAILMIVNLVLIRISVPEKLDDSTIWLEEYGRRIAFAIGLIPFAGIAFLWFLGVIRDRLGEFEDRFFSTVFFGSGLLFIAMAFISGATATSLLSLYAMEPEVLTQTPTYIFYRVFVFQLINVYGLRMAGVFMLSLGTIWVRTKIMPRTIVFLTYGLALVQLFGIDLTLWFSLVFPSWVFVISVAILILNFRQNKTETSNSMSNNVSPAEKTLLD